MNIKNEMKWVSIIWTGFSLSYFFISQFLSGENGSNQQGLQIVLKGLVLICILGRNLGVFAAQTI